MRGKMTPTPRPFVLPRAHGRGVCLPAPNNGHAVGIRLFPPATGGLDRSTNRVGYRPWERAAPTARSRPRPRRRGEDGSGVVARLDVDAIPGDAGQGGGPVMSHDGGHGGVNPPG